ncbi:AAA family ATPase [Cyanobium sp. Morenito 9A2]|uniref:AAA family ATPase n=1 Tax=Cyanobium sp. Morenito 9A2 TaxID=2823718 RepID=UPI0020CE0006|nr:AAA family ATPase [Cyanobium sp. Morenito 9A2]MCP9849007.1 AAA family ATPase [Cyanobium sp. Morenito 9A2]
MSRSSPESPSGRSGTDTTWLGALGDALSEALPRLAGATPDPLVAEAIGALAWELERGELVLALSGPAPEGLSATAWPDGHLQALAASPLAAEHPEAPLVLQGDQLAWRRWHGLKEQVIGRLIERANRPWPQAPSAQAIRDAVALAGKRGALDVRQCQAVAALLGQGLLLLGGGPGTGKTSTVVQLLAAALDQDPLLRLHLAAPTGKAAARLKAAIGEGLERVPASLAHLLANAPCTTLHRLLESNGERYRRHRHHLLDLDLLVVDELSMVDLPLMDALLEALPDSAQLVLVGDPAQLPPVGPGAVLLELQRPEHLQALGSAAVELTTIYRNNGALAAVAAVLRSEERDRPDPHVLRQALEEVEADANLQWLTAPPGRLPPLLRQRLEQHLHHLGLLAARLEPLEAPGTPPSAQPSNQGSGNRVKALLTELESCVLLTPVRRGAWGVEAIHRTLLGEQAIQPPRFWPLGTPLLCQRNLAEQGLANGDVGVLVNWAGERQVLFAAPAAEGGWRLIHPDRLPGAEPALALTIHKSQGSQYGEVLLLLPELARWDPRLLYTGLTRARERALLVTPPAPSWLAGARERSPLP